MSLNCKPSNPCYGCFGRFMGGTSKLTDFHSTEWTLVRNKKGKDSKKILKSSSGIDWKLIPKEQVNLLWSLPRKKSWKKHEKAIDRSSFNKLETLVKSMIDNDIELSNSKSGVKDAPAI